MMHKQIVAILIMLLSCNPLLASDEHAQAKVTLKVVDEQNIPISGARAGITFEELLFWDSKSTPVNGATDSDGLFTASGRTSKRAFWGADTAGYYPSNGTLTFDRNKDGRWEPWNPEVTVVLRKKENPVPMYARDTLDTKIIIPISGKEVGFDFIEFDWVIPYGKGKTSDIYFVLIGTYVNENNYDMQLKVKFSGNFDGIQTMRQDISQGSMLKLLRFAPNSGYQKEMIKFRTRQLGKKIEDNFDDLNNYYFRVRSEEKNNQLIRAMYGKIHGDIKFYPKSQSTATIVFKYYLNPDYTLNMEFGRNLFKGLNVGMD